MDAGPPDGGRPPRGRLVRAARLAALPAAHLGRSAVGLGKRIGGRPAEVVAAQVQQRTAERLFATLGQLKDGAMKVGQAMSAMEAALPDQLVGPYLELVSRVAGRWFSGKHRWHALDCLPEPPDLFTGRQLSGRRTSQVPTPEARRYSPSRTGAPTLLASSKTGRRRMCWKQTSMVPASGKMAVDHVSLACHRGPWMPSQQDVLQGPIE
ncbi:hypothetical protein GCM10010531_09140 [Blastococcus jejuensis]|uniref:Uncharacterized protein n=1 Tax=Blastococcus jejuensis TaxID=351224 RepID=A0ABP6NXJ0_9ACTN